MMDFFRTLFFSVGVVITALILFVLVIILLYVSYVLAMGIGLVLAVVVTYRITKSLRSDHQSKFK